VLADVQRGGRPLRAPIEKFGEALTATIGLLNFARFYEAFE
jgi:hypothetical protein